jgi:hypothetical protein
MLSVPLLFLVVMERPKPYSASFFHGYAKAKFKEWSSRYVFEILEEH